jgi:magnesium transporter
MSNNCFYHIPKSGKAECLDDLDHALIKAKDEGFVWLSYVKPTKEELSLLIDKLGIHQLSIEDCFDDQQIPKMDDYPNYTHILFNTFSYDDKILAIEEVNLFLGEKFIVSVSQHEADREHLLNDLREMVENAIERAKEGPSFVMHIIMDHIVDHKLEVIEAIEDELIAEEDTMLANLSDFKPAETQRIRRSLLALRKSLFHEREILIKICRKDCRFIPDTAIFHYSDIYDHLNKFVELVEINREILASLMQANLSILNNKMTKSANQTNRSVRRLTFVTTVFMPLTFFTGAFGMSEYSMMTGAENWHISYPAFFGVMVLIGIADYYILRWMGRNDEMVD